MNGCMLVLGSIARAADMLSEATLAQCFVQLSASAVAMAPKPKTGLFRIPFSDSLHGNNRRTEMLNAVSAA